MGTQQRTRPPIFTINQQSPLARGLAFAGLACGPGAGLFQDASLNRNDGTLANMDPATDWVWAEELGRWALDYDGSNDYVSIANMDTIVDAVQYQLLGTVSLWFRTSDNSQATQGAASLAADLTDGAPAWLIQINSGNLRTFTSGDIYWHSHAIANNTWYHYALTCDGTTYRLYYNGVAQSPRAKTAYTCHHGLVILGNGYNGYAVCQIADPIAWSRVLSPSEIAALADPSNVMLRCGGSALIREPRPLRSFIGQVGGAPPAGTPWLYCRRSARIVA